MGRALHFLVQLVVCEGTRQKPEVARLDVLERRRLLVRHAHAVAGIDLGDEPEADGISLADGAVEFIDHAAVHSGNSGPLGGILQFKIVDRPVRRKHVRGHRQSRGHRHTRDTANRHTGSDKA